MQFNPTSFQPMTLTADIALRINGTTLLTTAAVDPITNDILSVTLGAALVPPHQIIDMIGEDEFDRLAETVAQAVPALWAAASDAARAA